jgi:ectoine hydroxylase-related dioxygenase (phytanoyl-CoA dioxygenase family)
LPRRSFDVPEPNPDFLLTDEQVAAFHRDGFLAIPAITGQEEVARLRAIYDRLFERRAGRDEGNQFDLAGTDEEGKEAALPQILGPVKYAPELADFQLRANALAIARQLLGTGADYAGEHAILKPAHHGAPTPWHQDEAYWNPALEYRSLSVWVPLQEATLENGCMQFVPGSHKMDVAPHRSIGNDPRVHGLEIAADVDVSGAVACPLPPGGATFHLSGTLHYTGPNHTDQPRRAYILVFHAPSRPREIPRRFPWQEEKRTAREERAKAAKTADAKAKRDDVM